MFKDKALSALKSIWGFIINPNNRTIVLLIGVVVLAMLLMKQCSSNRDLKANMEYKMKIQEQNMRALHDTLRYEKNKNGDLEAIKTSFVTELKDLKELNRELYNEVKSEIGNVRGLIKGSLSVNTDPIVMSNELIKRDSTTYGLLFHNEKIDTGGFTWKIKGESQFKFQNNTIYPGTTTISENQMNMKVVLGFKENNNNYEVFARSNSPFVKFDELSGVLIIPKKADITCPPIKKKRWGIGPYVGVGVGYDFVNKTFGPNVGLGFSVHYSIFQW